MSSTLVFPDGVRLAREDELPGPEQRRAADWARIQSASIAPGYVLIPAPDGRFAWYAEINADAPAVWSLFADLCDGLLGPVATLVISEIDEEPVAAGSASVSSLMALLEPHKYQLTHDGRLQFGLASERDGTFNEVFVAPTKHFKVWLNDEQGFRLRMQQHGVREAERLEFLDEFPRATIALPADRVAFPDVGELISHLENAIAGMPGHG